MLQSTRTGSIARMMRRNLPFLFICYGVSYLDRVNAIRRDAAFLRGSGVTR